MKISLPAVSYVETTPQGTIMSVLNLTEIIESNLTALPGARTAYTFRKKGFEVLVLQHRDEKFSKSYDYVLSGNASELDIKSEEIDLRTCEWVKHPLFGEKYLAQHTPEHVRESWINAFHYKEDTAESSGLRSPQLGALHAIQAHWTITDETAIIVLPTGTGKTETMLSVTISQRPKCLLVIVPTDALRNQLAKKFATLGILPEFDIIENCELPITGIVKHGFKSKDEIDNYFSKVNVAVTTMGALTSSSAEMQQYMAEKLSHLFVDEAHHSPAETWNKFKKKMSGKPVVLFTATPFRNDGKRLEGKIVFNFPLRKAQEQDYFKPIRFRPVNEYDRNIADQVIAEEAIKALKEDLAKGYDHILMVRVNKIIRAEYILQFYEKHPEFNPIIVHSQIKPSSKLKELVQEVIDKKHRIIICVDMLGEGFDLPELKIAAFHDTKKSLAITLQLAGRFTRVKANLGPATFIANIAEPEVTEDLENLYYKDSDWNILLPDLSYKMSLEQEDFRTFLEGFKGFPDKFPVQAIKHPLSTIMFKTETKAWKPLSYKSGLHAVDKYDYVYSDYNDQEEVLLIITGQKSYVKWAKIEDFTSMNFDIIISYFDKKNKLLFIHSSNTGSYFEKFAKAIAPNCTLIKGQNMFRCFAGINRIRLHNVGVREPMGRAMNYIMRVGSDIKSALRATEIKKAIKSNIFGVGFEAGSRNSIGCSHNGRVWSMRSNNIPTWIKWCKAVAKKITDESIDSSLVLKGTLLPTEATRIHDSVAFNIEWPDFIYREQIGTLEIKYANGEEYPIWNCDLSIIEQDQISIKFLLETPAGKHRFNLELVNEPDRKDFKIEGDPQLSIIDGLKSQSLNEFFYYNPPLIYFADGSFLEGNLFTEVPSIIPAFDKDKIIGIDWTTADIRKESQTHLKDKASIQFLMLEKLKKEKNYEVIMDDDDKGEIADIVGLSVNNKEKTLNIDVYHCKYSVDGKAGTRIDNFYAVCSQAQKSIKWMENTDMIFKQLQKRSNQRLKIKGIDRFEKGDSDLLDLLKRRAKKDLKVKMNVYIVQPGLSITKYREDGDISKLLAAVESYLKETWNAPLTVYANSI
ncbi:DEAD/DEAH box helicase [Mucilaginibacter sp. R-33]|uniref:DEAD/DEAH box helicase n=1 Tax=Mucilaginibacter sp. R-33 TaxID=3416711 RepID=UPI003CE6D119